MPEGRNVGAAHVRGEFLFFFDNDAHLPRRDELAGLAAELRRDAGLAYVQPRIADPDTGGPLRRWVPLPPPQRPQPRLARPPQPASRADPPPPDGLRGADPVPSPRPPGPEARPLRLPRGPPHPLRPPAPRSAGRRSSA
ncbi:glycosyltransferase family A protein [Streptomyces bauhiniae]